METIKRLVWTMAMTAAFVLMAAAGARAAPATQPATRPATVVTQLPEKQSFHIYLLMGQSNMAGRDRRGLATQTDNPRVLALMPDGQWVIARDPMHPKRGRTEPGAGPGIPFALEMLKADPNVTIGLLPCAVGGSSLRHWVKGGDYYDAALKQAQAAAKVGVIKGVLWHQGEADTTSPSNAESYETRVVQALKDLRKDLGLSDLPVVVGQLGDFLKAEKYPYVETIRAAIKHLPAAIPNVGYADSTGLTDQGDSLHFNADSQKIFGARYAKAMQELKP